MLTVNEACVNALASLWTYLDTDQYYSFDNVKERFSISDIGYGGYGNHSISIAANSFDVIMWLKNIYADSNGLIYAYICYNPYHENLWMPMSNIRYFKVYFDDWAVGPPEREIPFKSRADIPEQNPYLPEMHHVYEALPAVCGHLGLPPPENIILSFSGVHPAEHKYYFSEDKDYLKTDGVACVDEALYFVVYSNSDEESLSDGSYWYVAVDDLSIDPDLDIY